MTRPHNHQSLFYKVFKENLLSNGTMMEAKVSSKASHAWRSILKEAEMLSKGEKILHALCCTHIYTHRTIL